MDGWMGGSIDRSIDGMDGWDGWIDGWHEYACPLCPSRGALPLDSATVNVKNAKTQSHSHIHRERHDRARASAMQRAYYRAALPCGRAVLSCGAAVRCYRAVLPCGAAVRRCSAALLCAVRRCRAVVLPCSSIVRVYYRAIVLL